MPGHVWPDHSCPPVCNVGLRIPVFPSASLFQITSVYVTAFARASPSIRGSRWCSVSEQERPAAGKGTHPTSRNDTSIVQARPDAFHDCNRSS